MMVSFLTNRQRVVGERVARVMMSALPAAGAQVPVTQLAAFTAAPAAIILSATDAQAEPNCRTAGHNGEIQKGSNPKNWKFLGYCNTKGGQGTHLGTYDKKKGGVEKLGSNDVVIIDGRYVRGGDKDTGRFRSEVSKAEAEALAAKTGRPILSGVEYQRRQGTGASRDTGRKGGCRFVGSKPVCN